MPIPSLLLAVAVATAGARPVHVALAFASEPTVSPAVTAAAVHETAHIWSRYHVVVDRTLPCASAPDEAIVLTVRIARSGIPRSLFTPAALGAITFADDGTPFSLITVYFDLLLQSLGFARIGDAGEDRWPSELRQRVIGRAFGRVIAHELGHYLLASRRHSGDGLMRAVQSYRDLFSEADAGFVLSRADARRFVESVAR
jgi:hypothetical protein